MTRTWFILSALFAAAPASAGMKAIYDGESEPRRLEIEVADNGDFRVGPPGAPAYALQVGKTFYMVQPAKDGSPEVIRIDDMAAAIGQALPPEIQRLFQTLFSEAARAQPAAMPKVVKSGTRKVAGFPGQVYTITLSGSPPQTGEFVISNAPELAPIGRAMGLFLESTMVMAAPLLGDMATGIIQEMRGVFALGTPIEAKDRFRLVSAATADVPAARVALPAKPLTPAEIDARIQRNPAPAN